MMTESVVLKKSRAPYRAVTTRLCTKIEDLLKNANTPIEEFEECLEQLNAKAEKLKDLDNRILFLLEEDEIENEILACAEYEDKIISYQLKLKRKLRKEITNVERSSDALSTISSSEIQQTVAARQDAKTVKLPKLFISKFYGEQDKYLDFWSQYETAIHKNPSLSDVDKFAYLKSLLGGIAANAISGFALTEANYAAAIKILKERFGRHDMVVQAHLSNLLNLSPLRNMEDLRGLRTLYDKLETEIRSLESIGVTSDTFSSLLCPIILKLLPPELTLQFSRKQDENVKWDVQSLTEFLRFELESRERAAAVHRTEGKRNQNPKFDRNTDKYKSYKQFSPKRIPNVSTAVELLAPNENACVFCGSAEHKSESCLNLKVNEKKDVLKKQGRCFVCLDRGHRIAECKNKKKLCPICEKFHHVALCYKRENSAKSKVMASEQVTNTVSNYVAAESKILLQTATVDLVGKRGRKTIRCVFDGGAQRTYIDKKLSTSLSLTKVGNEELLIHTFHSKTPSKQLCSRVKVRMRNRCTGREIYVEALEIDEITQAVLEVPDATIGEELLSRGLTLADEWGVSEVESNISMLIGADYYWQIVTGKTERLSEGLVAAESKLGWLLMGKMGSEGETKCGSAATEVTAMLVHSSTIENLWRLDVIGISDPVETKSKVERECAALEHFQKTVKIDEEGRYEIQLPWIEDKVNLKSNFDGAEKRCRSVAKKLINKRGYLEYEAVFEEWVREEVIEDVPLEEVDNPCHYLPHRGVYKENSTTKIRPVFDASCRPPNSPSLNDCLEKGPNLLEQIPPILMRFRKEKLGVISDIRKAFLQISVSKIDRDFLRFFWWKDYDQKVLRTFRHNRVVFGLNCSPFLLAAVLNHLIEKYFEQFEETCSILKKSFYVDNCVTSVPNEEKLQKFVQESTHILRLGCFDLRGWEYTTVAGEDKAEKPTPVLGLLWDRNEDVLFCNVEDITFEPEEITRRTVLSTVHRIFDVIGVLCPTTLIPKLIVQRSWELKIGWDTPLPEEYQTEFRSWLKDVFLLKEVKLPRCLNLSESTELSLHTFFDGSKHAYSAVVFLRTVENQEVNIRLIMAKSRLTPLHKITIPRTELMACCIGARLASTVIEALSLKDIPCFYWSDSTTALAWIKKEEHWGVFVGNRVKEIRTLTQKNAWRHIPSALNPADLPSRGCQIKTLVKSEWWLGPQWLRKNENDWPEAEVKIDEDEVMGEARRPVLQALSCNDSEDRWYLKYFSKYSKLLRMMAWIMRFISNCREETSAKKGELTVSEIDAAEKRLCRIVQKEEFEEDTKLRNLCTFVDGEGLIRVKTKILRRNDEEDFICPVVLPSNHELTERIISHYHRQSSHAGVQFVLTYLRQKFWILRGRKTVQRVLTKCVRCQRYRAKSVETVPAPLPEDRVRDALVFEVTGVDLAGPLYLKGSKKAWIVLYTCAVYRAVHLELITSLSTEAFFQSFRRFIARRGRPTVVYSDNGTNFTGANNAFSSIDWQKILQETALQRINWKFSPPTAAWWGGWWERLIQMVKKLLRNVLGKACMTYEEMLTILCDVESVINSRPLTYLSEDPSDLTPLIPLMFLQDVHKVGVPDLDHLDRVDLSRRQRFVQHVREQFRKRFRDEYLSLLVQKPTKRQPSAVKKDDLVLVASENKKRIDWPIGRVIETFPGKDSEVRVVKVRTASGELTRPVKRIFPLELSYPSDSVDKDSPSERLIDSYKTRYGRKTVKPASYF